MNKINAISVNKVDDLRDKFSIKMYKQDKVVDILFKEVTILLTSSKSYAIL